MGIHLKEGVVRVYDERILKFRIKELLKARNMTQVELAKAIGCSSSNINTALNGTSTLGMKKLESIARVLKVEVADLFERTGWCADEYRPEEVPTVRVDYGSAHYNLTASEFGKVMDVMGCPMKTAVEILEGKVPVTPRQWSMIAAKLEEKAFAVMPRINVKLII